MRIPDCLVESQYYYIDENGEPQIKDDAPTELKKKYFEFLEEQRRGNERNLEYLQKLFPNVPLK